MSYVIGLSKCEKTKKYRGEFTDSTGSFVTGLMKLKGVEDDLNHYLISLGYNFKIVFYSGNNVLTIKERSL